MVALSSITPLSPENLSVFCAKDQALSDSRIFVLYGPSPTANGTSSSSSRVQSHVFTPAGFQSYQRLAVSPSSPLYKAVECLSREEQGDEVCRALAFSLLKYFSELSETAKDTWVGQCLSTNQASSALKLFSESHAARLASQMVKVDDSSIIPAIEKLLSTQSLSYIDIDVVLPPGSINKNDSERESVDSEDGDRSHDERYGSYAELIKLLGEPTFLPTSKLRRAPSRPTNVNRTTSFSKTQKEALRREMCELVDTEENYVAKLYDLLHSVAAEFREKAASKPCYSSSPSVDAISGLFPSSLDKILEVNSAFLESIRKALDETEDEAIKDIEGNNQSTTFQPSQPVVSQHDPTGVTAFANLFLCWFPQFSDCYGDYIQAHGNFGEFLKIFMNETGSSFAKRVQETGEQRMMSMLIEPVQRLPRYSLYIDNMVKQLPSRHPALKSLAKAKDIISEICAQDKPSLQQSKLVYRLREAVSNWPLDFAPESRLITAIDAREVPAPFGPKQQDDQSEKFIMLLFSQVLVLIKRPSNNSMGARGLLGMIDSFSTFTSESNRQSDELVFSEWIAIDDSRFTELDNGNLIRVTRLNQETHSKAKVPRVFYLEGPYEGKTAKWIKDVVKARVEGRYSESEREGAKWEARMLEPTANINLGFFSAITEDVIDQQGGRCGNPGAVRLIFDPVKCFKRTTAGETGIDIVASVSGEGDGFYRLEIDATNERGTRDLVTTAEFIPVLSRRLGNLLQMKSQIRNPAIAPALLQHYQDVLRSLSPTSDGVDQKSVRSRIKRPPSPVKALSNLFGGSPSKENPSSNPSQSSPIKLGQAPSLLQLSPTKSQSNVETGIKPNSSVNGTRIVSKDISISTNSIESLERTLNNYVLALHARKGNVIGRVVANRALADEASVNELYNTLLEHPDDHERTAQAPVDVLFSSFEKFLKNAWQERLGPVITSKVLDHLQEQSETLSPLDFEEHVGSIMAELAPQNSRAFRAIVNLLSELLDGTGNDGDRGVLTAAITEIVVDENDPYKYISLFDRFVVDQEILGGNTFNSVAGATNPGSISSAFRSTNAGSIGSKASSFSKRLGLGSLRRENSQNESKFGAVLRSWSKASRSGENSVKPVLNRTKSADLDAQLSNGSRPTSSHSAAAFGAMSDSRPSTAQSIDKVNSPASRIQTPGSTNTVKKKRRSSLSDLRSLPVPDFSPFLVSPTLRKTPEHPKPLNPAFTPETPSPTKNAHAESPTRSRSFLESLSRKKENVLPIPLRPQTVREPIRSVEDHSRPGSSGADSARSNAQNTKASLADVFEIPSSADVVPPGVLSERPASGNTPAPNKSSKTQEQGSSPKKFRVQSPQKLRERLETHQSAIVGAGSSLQDELNKIGEELNALNSRSGDTQTGSPSRSPSKRDQTSANNLNTRLKALETKLPHLVKNLTEHTATLERDMVSSLQSSDKKVKQLDIQLQQANAENEALYTRINEELSNIFNAVRGGDGVDQLKKRMQESQDEAARLRKECQRLNRENAGLRALFDEG